MYNDKCIQPDAMYKASNVFETILLFENLHLFFLNLEKSAKITNTIKKKR